MEVGETPLVHLCHPSCVLSECEWGAAAEVDVDEAAPAVAASAVRASILFPFVLPTAASQ